MEFIRGATTIKEDNEENILLAVAELMDGLFLQNALKKDEAKCIVFSLTQDIHSFSPAKAARMSGYSSIPLFSCVEPDISGSLPLCIRVMVGAERGVNSVPVKHVYLRGAKVLRRDKSEILNVALDGPAGSGKSTVAKALAAKYGILYLDTGAMYRACALYALEQGINPKDGAAVAAVLDDITVKVEYRDGTQHTYLNGKDVSLDIRKNEVSLASSDISAHYPIRMKMVDLQREIAKSMSCVIDGRDIGSYVLPDADFKFFVTADSRVRAERRYKELLSRGQQADFEALHAEIVLRDKQDAGREFSPLVQAADAVVVDTSNMNIEEVVAYIDRQIQKKI